MTPVADKRRNEIIEFLERRQMARVGDLSEHFNVSEVSIRRDLQYLEDLGLLKRVHGGAVAISQFQAGEPLYSRMQQQIEKKERIGQAAADLLRSGDRLILDSGTTTLQVASHIDLELRSSGSLTVITASLPIVREIGSCPGIHLILLGGIYLAEFDLVVGPQTIDQLKDLHVDKMFLGTDGMTLTHGLTTANVLEAEVDRAMVRSASEVIVVSDSSKIGVSGLATIMPLARMNKLITDTGAPPDFVSHLREQGIEVILV
jgi:DeoR/GlpR family transcriptional regulator of sugar metabolism